MPYATIIHAENSKRAERPVFFFLVSFSFFLSDVLTFAIVGSEGDGRLG